MKRAHPARVAIDWTLCGLAGALALAMLYTALHDASQAWDVWYYHMPFAARLAGIVRAGDYALSAANQARFEGFPLFGERVQGLLWRLTGHAESANLFSLASVPLVAWFLRARYGVPWAVTVLALLGVPLVHTHATSAYVDLPANAAAAVAVLVAIDAWSAPPSEPLDARGLAIALVAMAIAANTKALLHPIAAAALVALFLRSALDGRRGAMLACVVAAPIVFATPLANLAVHGNPYYPLRMVVAGHVLPGPEEPYSSSPLWLEHAPRVVRFACSIFEVGALPFSDPHRWTVDQWAPGDSPALRTGGFFGAYVAVLLAALAWLTVRDRSRVARASVLGFALLTVIVSNLPQSHELRYYLVWMIALVAIVLRLAARASPFGPRALGAVGALACGVILFVTGGVYAWPTGSTFRALVAAHTDAALLESLPDGARLCVVTPRWNLLWASAFHAPKRYLVKDAETRDECPDGYRVVE